MKLHAFALFLFVPVASAVSVPFEDCVLKYQVPQLLKEKSLECSENSRPLPNGAEAAEEGSRYYLESVEISGCHSYPCKLKIGSVYNVTLTLHVSNDNFNEISVMEEVYFEVNRVRQPAIVTSNPCLAKGNSCIPQIGQKIHYTSELTVTTLPPLPAVLYWTLKNLDETLVCYKVTVILSS